MKWPLPSPSGASELLATLLSFSLWCIQGMSHFGTLFSWWKWHQHQGIHIIHTHHSVLCFLYAAICDCLFSWLSPGHPLAAFVLLMALHGDQEPRAIIQYNGVKWNLCVPWFNHSSGYAYCERLSNSNPHLPHLAFLPAFLSFAAWVYRNPTLLCWGSAPPQPMFILCENKAIKAKSKNYLEMY